METVKQWLLSRVYGLGGKDFYAEDAEHAFFQYGY